jgi:hypothetical protein
MDLKTVHITDEGKKGNFVGEILKNYIIFFSSGYCDTFINLLHFCRPLWLRANGFRMLCAEVVSNTALYNSFVRSSDICVRLLERPTEQPVLAPTHGYTDPTQDTAE